MDTEGSHSGDRNGCGDGKQWRRGKGIVGERKRAACRRYAIVVSPTQLVPEVLAVWGSD